MYMFSQERSWLHQEFRVSRVIDFDNHLTTILWQSMLQHFMLHSLASSVPFLSFISLHLPSLC